MLTEEKGGELLRTLYKRHRLQREEWEMLIEGQTPSLQAYAAELAVKIREPIYGKRVYVRGLIEFTNHCRNDCYYCGIRRSNTAVHRYRLTADEILNCCNEGYELGFRTFVLQGGEDAWYSDEKICEILRRIKESHPDCAITLSVGEKSKESYQAYREAGADRYLLRHESANEGHYASLHPKELSVAHRKKCLRDLKALGYQVGAGFMVGSPGQTSRELAEDMMFLKELEPHMVGIGPFIPHHDTPLKDASAGELDQTLFLISLLRLMLPQVLLPATTALGTIHPLGRERGIQAGANVIMPNLSPTEVRKDYLLYDNKICTGDESAQCKHCLEDRMKKIGYEIVVDRGDSPMSYCFKS